MGFKHQILAGSYPVLQFFHLLKRYIGKNKKGSLRVLVYHDIGPNEIDKFEAQIGWLAKRWNFVDAATFSSMMSGEQSIVGDNLLLTFDDGFASNRLVADEILSPLGIKAIFFVVAGFIEQSSIESARDFISKGIRSDVDPAKMPHHWLNMSWSDLEHLLLNGHTVGAHTETHPRLSELADRPQLIYEIIDSANKLESKLGIKIDHFAFTFGNSASLSRDAFLIATRRFNYIYTSLRGNNAVERTKISIYRETISPTNSNYLVGSFLLGGADWMYKKAKDKIRLYF